jgi:hypothetical protein
LSAFRRVAWHFARIAKLAFRELASLPSLFFPPQNPYQKDFTAKNAENAEKKYRDARRLVPNKRREIGCPINSSLVFLLRVLRGEIVLLLPLNKKIEPIAARWA